MKNVNGREWSDADWVSFRFDKMKIHFNCWIKEHLQDKNRENEKITLIKNELISSSIVKTTLDGDVFVCLFFYRSNENVDGIHWYSHHVTSDLSMHQVDEHLFIHSVDRITDDFQCKWIVFLFFFVFFLMLSNNLTFSCKWSCSRSSLMHS